MRQRFVRAISAIYLLVALAGCATGAEPRLELAGTFTWKMDHPAFGGISGLELAQDGQEMLVISDRGTVIRGHIQRDGVAISGIEASDPERLRATTGAVLKNSWVDAEGLADDLNGGFYVSFEGQHRVLHYDASGKVTRLPPHADFAQLIPNSSLESLAIDRSGTLYTLPERSGKLTRPYPVYRYRDGRWDIPFSIRRMPGVMPVGADFGPDGKLYLLEREFTGISFRNQVRRFTIQGDRLSEDGVLLQAGPGKFGNLEGISLWRGGDGRIRITMIADDNFKFFQSTQIVEYILTE